MSVTGDRLLYSPITTRPKLTWPGGTRLAVWIVLNIEHYEYRPDPIRVRDPWPRTPHPDILGYSMRDYGNRVGLWRMLDVLDRYSVACTVSANLGAFEYFPAVLDACRSRNWDILSHGIYNTQYHWGLEEEEERKIIENCVDKHFQMTGKPLKGWFSPANTNTINTPDLVAEAGIRYYCDWFPDDQPFPLQVRSGRLVTLPYSMDLNDGWNFRGSLEIEEFADAVIAQFDRLYEDSSVTGRVMSLPLHPFVLGLPHRISHFERILKHIISRQDIWVTTGGDMADWFIENQLPALEAYLLSEAGRRERAS